MRNRFPGTKPLLVVAVAERRNGLSKAFRKGVASRRFISDSIGHPLQGATWQPVVKAAAYSFQFPLGNLLILNKCRS